MDKSRVASKTIVGTVERDVGMCDVNSDVLVDPLSRIIDLSWRDA